MVNTIYNLPQMYFVGGESQKIRFNLKTESGNAFHATECVAELAILQYNNKGGTPVLTKEISFHAATNGTLSIGMVELLPEDTIHLQGRFIYQITIRSADGTVEIPGKGLIDISENINPLYITN